MKKFLLSIATCVLVFSSCSQNEAIDTPQPGNSAVNFSVYAGKAVRGVDIASGTEAIQSSKIGVYAYKTAATTVATGAEWMETELSYGSSWVATPLIYWPVADDGVGFFAVGKNAAYTWNKGTETVAPTIDFTVNTTASKQTDLLAAYVPNQKSTNSPVSLILKHMLSKIVFKGKLTAAAETAGLTVTINSITLNNLKGSGTYSFVGNTTTTFPAYGSWTVSGNDVTYNYGLTSPQISSQTTTTLADNGGDLLIIPQVTKTATIGYSITQNGVSVVTNGSYTIDLSKISSPWNPNKLYTYNLLFSTSSEGLQPITFTVDVDAWENEESNVSWKDLVTLTQFLQEPVAGLTFYYDNTAITDLDFTEAPWNSVGGKNPLSAGKSFKVVFKIAPTGTVTEGSGWTYDGIGIATYTQATTPIPDPDVEPTPEP